MKTGEGTYPPWAEARQLLAHAIVKIDLVLNDHLPAGPGDEKPPANWEGWHMAYNLLNAKLELGRVLLDDLPDD